MSGLQDEGRAHELSVVKHMDRQTDRQHRQTDRQTGNKCFELDPRWKKSFPRELRLEKKGMKILNLKVACTIQISFVS